MTDDLVAWLRQPRWVEGAAQKRLFEAADEIERLREAVEQAYNDGVQAALSSEMDR